MGLLIITSLGGDPRSCFDPRLPLATAAHSLFLVMFLLSVLREYVKLHCVELLQLNWYLLLHTFYMVLTKIK